MNENEILLFVGDDVSDPGEQQLIARLQRDLSLRGVPSTLFANFFPVTRTTCQIDLLVRTPFRTAHVEIKSLNRDYPVHGGQNGPWVQVLPNRDRRSLGGNAGRQALKGTYAISDAMRELARTGSVSGSDFKTSIDTLVGVWLAIPGESRITPPPHVNVVGYAELVERLVTPGPRVDWGDDEWDAFIRSASLFRPEQETPVEERRRSSAEAIADYRVRARASFGANLQPLVDIGASAPGRDRLLLADIDHMVKEGDVVGLVGPPGFGKTFSAQHLALRHCDEGRLVIWLRAGEYEQGHFSRLVARAMAPFSAERWTELVQPAPDVGVAMTVVVDGLNECPEHLRLELLQQLQAFVLRHAAGVIVTSTRADGLADVVGATIVEAGVPDEEKRIALLEVHGAVRPEWISAQFHTPYELSIAAKCESELSGNASVTDLHAAYVRRFAASEYVRGGLSALASHMHSKLRSSLRMLEASAVLHDNELDLSPGQIDEVFDCPLLNVERQHITFRHELVGQFLAAEHLVRSASSGAELGRLLALPANQVLTSSALSIEPDPSKVCNALSEIADAAHTRAAIRGEYGSEVAEMVNGLVRDVLHLGVAVTNADRVEFVGADEWLGRWVTDVSWTPSQRALLAAAGEALMSGLFVDEVCELLDRTDEVCVHQAKRLRADGVAAPTSTVVASTYCQVYPADGSGLAASYVTAAFELSSMVARFAPNWCSPGIAQRFAETSAPYPWGRLYIATMALNPDRQEDQVMLPGLLQRCWDAGGYHVQLQALWAAQRFSGCDEPHRTEILQALDAFTTNNVMLQSTALEVLASFEQIESGTSAADIRGYIEEILAHPEDDGYYRSASQVVSLQFEDERIVGPYFDVVDSLDEADKVRLYSMAALGATAGSSMFIDWTLSQLCELVPTDDQALDDLARAAFAVFLDGPPADATMPVEAAIACLEATRGWAKFGNVLPQGVGDLTSSQRNWRLMANLLLKHENDDTSCDPDETWAQLLADRSETILTVASLHGASNRSHFEGLSPALHLLYDLYSTELRELFEWALEHPHKFSVSQVRRRSGQERFVISSLGLFGNLATVARLRLHTLDPDSGYSAVAAIRQIHQRLGV